MAIIEEHPFCKKVERSYKKVRDDFEKVDMRRSKADDKEKLEKLIPKYEEAVEQLKTARKEIMKLIEDMKKDEELSATDKKHTILYMTDFLDNLEAMLSNGKKRLRRMKEL